MDYLEDKRNIKIAMISFAALLALQLAADLLTNFQALLAQLYMKVGEILVSAFLLLSAYWSHKPADQLHMFSHGRAQNVAALVSVTSKNTSLYGAVANSKADDYNIGIIYYILFAGWV